MLISKNELRKLMKEKRAGITSNNKALLDKSIYEKVISSEHFIKAKIIFIYVSYRDEVDTHEIIKYALSQNKRICVPKVLSKASGMIAAEIKSLSELKEGTLGILEPSEKSNAVNPKDIELVLLPGLAFDKQGGRLGYGGGFYDRYLESIEHGVRKVGLAYSFQIVEEVPMEKQDITIDAVITE